MMLNGWIKKGVIMNVLVMMIIASVTTGGTVHAANNYDNDSNKVVYKKSKEYKPKKEKKFTILGYEVKKVKPK